MNAPLSVGPTDVERMKLIEAVTSDAAGFLGVDPVMDSPADVVKKIIATEEMAIEDWGCYLPI